MGHSDPSGNSGVNYLPANDRERSSCGVLESIEPAFNYVYCASLRETEAERPARTIYRAGVDPEDEPTFAGARCGEHRD